MDSVPGCSSNNSGSSGETFMTEEDDATLVSSTTATRQSNASLPVDMHAMILLSLQFKHHIPASTVSLISQEISGLFRFHKELAFNQILPILRENGINDDVSVKLVDVINSCFNCDFYELRTAYSRQLYFQKILPFVPPVSYSLPVDVTCSERTYQYVPILQSLALLLSHEEVCKQFLDTQQESNDSVLKDYYDGMTFKQNRLFSSHRSTLQIILYQYSFEVVNPLGSAKKIHKILAVYFSLGNLYCYNRSRINPMQLVILCKEKYIDSRNVTALFQPLINDLKILETEGLDVGLKEKVYGRIVAITGDNLGSNWIGGFETNFSSATYMCRFCTAESSAFFTNEQCQAEKRTISSYHESLAMIEENNLLQHHGVKFSSPFNQLQYFHVCNPGLPPCIGHDVFEGVVCFDMALFVNHFIGLNWFTESYLNDSIAQFKFDSVSRQSKCVPFKQFSNKLGGNASQVWCFVRFFPLFVLDKVKDGDNPVWKAMLLLRLIVELVCAPKISYSQIAFLSEIISGYIQLRCCNFPHKKLRPKHHFVMHYPWLILQFGPLIHLWTLRFESKHRYFTTIVRPCHNFVNITQHLSHSHQMLQGYLHKTELFVPKLLPSGQVENIFSEDVYNTIKNTGINFEDENCQFYKQVQYRGTTYNPEQVLVLGKDALDFNLGKVAAIFLFNSRVYFAVQCCVGYFLPKLGLYIIRYSSDVEYDCVQISS